MQVTGGERMSCKTQSVSLVCFLVLMLLFCGCEFMKKVIPGGSRAKEVGVTPADEEKTRLLKKIDHRFEDVGAHFELGQLYQADGMWTQAEYEYNTALSFNPSYRPAQAAMVKALIEGGSQTRAEIYSDIYIGQASSSATESLRLGLAFQKQTLDDYALTCYRQALNLAPNSAKVNRQVGYYYLSKNEKDVARSYLKRSFDLDRNQPDVAGELGRLGVAVRIPRKAPESPKKLDQIVERSDKEIEAKP